MTIGGVLVWIQAQWTTAGLGTAITGGLHFGDAPGGVNETAMPYVVVTVVSAPVDERTSGPGTVGEKTEYSNAQIQFNLYHNEGATATSALADLLRAAFRNATLTLSGADGLYCQLSVEMPIGEPGFPKVIRWTQVYDLKWSDTVAA